jgi:periplasmic copper chaperone A
MLRLTMLATAMLVPFIAVSVGAAGNDGPTIDHAWARATPGSAKTGAAYFTIESPIDDRLIGLATPVAGKAELHTHSEENGMMRMHAVEGGLAIAADRKVELKPGGLLHVMLIDLNRKLQAGDRFPLVLTFEKAGPRDVMVKVEPLGAMGPSDDTGMKRNVSDGAPDHGVAAHQVMPHDGSQLGGRSGS